MKSSFLWLGILPSIETAKRRDTQNRLEGKAESEQCGPTDAGHPSTRYIQYKGLLLYHSLLLFLLSYFGINLICLTLGKKVFSLFDM